MPPPTEISIRDDPSCPARRLRLWRDAVGDHLADVDLAPAGDLPPSMTLRGSLRLRVYRAATVARIRAGAQALSRTRERIRRSSSDVVFFNVVTRGWCRLDQHGLSASVGAGGICLYDTAAPYGIETSYDFASVLVGAPRRALEARLGDIRPVVGAVRGGPAATIASRYWLALADELGADDGSAASLIGSGLDVLATAILADRDGAGPAPARATVERARRAIREGFADARFSAADVALATGVSLRRLQELFQREGDAIGLALRRARLDHARGLLADARLGGLPIKEIMARAGFSDPAHFSRAFRRSFGVGPDAFRASQRPPGGEDPAD